MIFLPLLTLLEVGEFPFPLADSQHPFPTYIRFLLDLTETFEVKRDMNKFAYLLDVI